ncbi:SDR family oxidoreductase [Herbiconiux moechotypicola]|uniref:3-oxoacyl-[acyl-carrier-protein] reductase n=1 Tax=Herbiconiux moechotypicola TaxID=637393 RepID=A0ABP5QYR0_9MICO|nr:SDR family oxidoreductase [Herbiconiux moechotypicola]MCS5731533.1 SDR family oxidoreductase [Herbiconiux moechotypicola]
MKTITHPAWAQSATDLSGRTILVIGGGGGVGEGVVRTLLKRGAAVVATGRDELRLRDFADRVGHSSLHVAPLDGLAADLTERADLLAAEFGPFDGVVVSIASWGSHGSKPLLALSDGEWSDLVEDNLTAVFRVYRAFTPTLAPGGVLLQLNGLSADLPFPGNGVVALGAAAGKSLTRTLAAELDGTGLRVYEVILGVVRTRARQLAGVDNPLWIDGTEIGVHIAELVSGDSPLTGEVLHYFIDKATGPVATPPRF